MIFFISPAKGFKHIDEKGSSLPVYLNNTEEIIEVLKTLSQEDISKYMKVKDNIALLNKDRFSNFKFDINGFPALKSYDGIQYKNISASDFSKEDMEFAEKHLRILSGLYGVLKPSDSIYPYRLDFLTKININNKKNLYEYWDDLIYREVSRDSNGVIINLASDEYSKTIKKYVYNEKYISCIFKVKKGNDYKVQSTASKKARGLMTRFIIKNKIDNHEKLKDFSEGGYKFSKELSSENEWIYVLE